MTTKEKYHIQIQKLLNDQYHYLAITPTDGLKSIGQFRSLIKKSMRNYSKSHGLNQPHTYFEYLSVIEVNPAITKGERLYKGKFPKKRLILTPTGEEIRLDVPKNTMDEMGYHTHVFVATPKFNTNHSMELRETWETTFRKDGISIDLYEKSCDKIYTVPRFKNYHAKQLDQLDDSFLITNLHLDQ